MYLNVCHCFFFSKNQFLYYPEKQFVHYINLPYSIKQKYHNCIDIFQYTFLHSLDFNTIFFFLLFSGIFLKCTQRWVTKLYTV